MSLWTMEADQKDMSIENENHNLTVQNKLKIFFKMIEAMKSVRIRKRQKWYV